MKVIVINGPMGVGKTTIGKYIAEKNKGTAFIDGDWYQPAQCPDCV